MALGRKLSLPAPDIYNGQSRISSPQYRLPTPGLHYVDVAVVGGWENASRPPDGDGGRGSWELPPAGLMGGPVGRAPPRRKLQPAGGPGVQGNSLWWRESLNWIHFVHYKLSLGFACHWVLAAGD